MEKARILAVRRARANDGTWARRRVMRLAFCTLASSLYLDRLAAGAEAGRDWARTRRRSLGARRVDWQPGQTGEGPGGGEKSCQIERENRSEAAQAESEEVRRIDGLRLEEQGRQRAALQSNK